MKRKIITTADGSKTIHIEEWNEQYHSVHGAIIEAKHVYIKHALFYFLNEFKFEKDSDCYSEGSKNQNKINILEIGFGTGLNAFLTLLEAEKQDININYVGVEAYPITDKEMAALNYPELISEKHKTEFQKLHNSDWEKEIKISKNFRLKKENKFFKDITNTSEFDIIYFDAFGFNAQPHLWTDAIFQIMYNALKSKGVLTTYASVGVAKRAMRAVGFKVKRLAGPPNKRHMVRAIKR